MEEKDITADDTDLEIGNMLFAKNHFSTLGDTFERIETIENQVNIFFKS